MVQKTYKNILIGWISIITLIVLPAEIAQSCGMTYHGEEYRVSFFSPRLINEGVFESFYYTAEFMNNYEIEESVDNETNCKEWQAQVGNSVRLEDIDEFLYNTDADDFLNAHQEGNLEKKYLTNTFIIALLRPENEEILNYLVYAKQAEFSNFSQDDPWGLDDPRFKFDPTAYKQNLLKQIEKKIRATESSFLKERYGYQLVINARKVGEWRYCLKAYNDYLQNAKTILKPWGALHAARSAYELERNGEAQYYLGITLDGSVTKRTRAVAGSAYEDVNAALAFAKSNEERAAALIAGHLNYPGRSFEAIQKIYRYAPNYKYFPLMIQREIRKLEDWLLTPFLTDFFSVKERVGSIYDYPKQNEKGWEYDYYTHYNYKKDLTYLRNFRQFLEDGLNSNWLPEHQDFLNLAIAHLYFMDYEPVKARQYLTAVQSSENKKLLTQMHIENILLTPQDRDISLQNVQADLYKSFHWLQQNHDLIENPLRTLAQLHLYLSKKYLKKGNVGMAGLFYRKSALTAINGEAWSDYYAEITFFDKYGSVDGIQQTLNILDKKGKTDFEKYATTSVTKEESATGETDDSWHSNWWRVEGRSEISQTAYKQQLLEIQGTIAFRGNDLETAHQTFSKLPKSYWKKVEETWKYFYFYLQTNPFASTQQMPWDVSRKENANISKAKIVKRILELKKNPTPENLYLIGNAYYNFTYWGKSWSMYSYGRSRDELRAEFGTASTFADNIDKHFEVYYGGKKAVEYYKKVLDSKANDELRARAMFMIAQCDTHRNHAVEIRKKGWWEAEKKYLSPIFKDFDKRFKHTKMWKNQMWCASWRE